MRYLMGSLVVLSLLYLGACAYFSSSIVAPARVSMEEDRAGVEELGFTVTPPEVAAQELLIPSPVGELSAWYYAHPEPAGCAVILLHGVGGARWGGLRYSQLFWPRGCDVLAPDLRGHGLSPGDAVTYGVHERLDVLAMIDLLTEDYGYSREQIGLMGVSMGGAVALMTGALEPELAFVAADASFEDLPTIVSRRGRQLYGPGLALIEPGAFWVAGLRGDFDMKEASPALAARDLLMPAFILHSREDEFTPWRHSQAVFDAIPHGRKVIHITEWGAPHGASVKVDEPAYVALMAAFLDEHVPGFGRDPGAVVEEPEPEEDPAEDPAEEQEPEPAEATP